MWKERKIESDSNEDLANLHELKFIEFQLREALVAKKETEKCFESPYFEMREEKSAVLIRLKKKALEFKNGLGKPECYTNTLIGSIDWFIKMELSQE